MNMSDTPFRRGPGEIQSDYGETSSTKGALRGGLEQKLYAAATEIEKQEIWSNDPTAENIRENYSLLPGEEGLMHTGTNAYLRKKIAILTATAPRGQESQVHQRLAADIKALADNSEDIAAALKKGPDLIEKSRQRRETRLHINVDKLNTAPPDRRQAWARTVLEALRGKDDAFSDHLRYGPQSATSTIRKARYINTADTNFVREILEHPERTIPTVTEAHAALQNEADTINNFLRRTEKQTPADEKSVGHQIEERRQEQLGEKKNPEREFAQQEGVKPEDLKASEEKEQKEPVLLSDKQVFERMDAVQEKLLLDKTLQAYGDTPQVPEDVSDAITKYDVLKKSFERVTERRAQHGDQLDARAARLDMQKKFTLEQMQGLMQKAEDALKKPPK